jgi:hypothetical protein
MKWGTPSEQAWAFQRRFNPDLEGECAWQVAAAYDAGRCETIKALIAAGVDEVCYMADVATGQLGGPVQLLSSECDEPGKQVTFTWERR